MHPRTCAPIAAAALFLFVSIAQANHGPGTSGGGSFTLSGETLKQGKFDLSVREDFTQFQNVSVAQAEQRALSSGEFDALNTALILSGSIAYGITDDLQVSAAIGYYWGNNFIDAQSEDGVTAEASTADPEGLTDLALNLKYRFLKGQPGNLSVIGGIIVPTGKDNVLLTNGEPLEPSSQPGTGEWGYQMGLAYSRFLTSRITLDASGLYTFRTPHDDFKVGDRVDLGTALAYRLTESIKTTPNWSVFGEVNAVWLGKDDDDGELNPNSGGWSVYLTVGARVRITPNVALTVAPSVPVVQELNGDQIEARYKLSAALSFSF